MFKPLDQILKNCTGMCPAKIVRNTLTGPKIWQPGVWLIVAKDTFEISTQKMLIRIQNELVEMLN